MDIKLDINYELKDDKYNEFIDYLEESNILNEFILFILKEEDAITDRTPYISLLLTNNENIRIINREYRNKDSETDVISFAYHETDDFMLGPFDTLGDIIISLERIESQAQDFNHSFKREFFYCLAHGILHILGYDHMEEDEKIIMREKEEFILNKFNFRRDN